MNSEIRQLEPKPVWDYFSNLNAVPRASKKEDQVIEFMMEFGRKLGLETSKDKIGNVLIKKPASAGREDRPTVALQSHLDMVHQKNAATDFDFATQGIEMILEDGWVRANGTTLGADNGIGVAYAMSVLASDDLVHPPIEALFTIDEETGMTGAKGLEGGVLSARYMLNLDTEEDTELCIGCAGGVDVVATGEYPTEEIPVDHTVLRLELTGLTGGHSGMDIHLGRGNSNKLMNRALVVLARECQARLVSIDGGGLRNAIPRESMVSVAIPQDQQSRAEELLSQLQKNLATEYRRTDPDLSVSFESWPLEPGSQAATCEMTLNFTRAIHSLPNGIYRLSPEVEGLVQTSSNLARITFNGGSYEVACLVRGSVDSEKLDLADAIVSCLEQIGAQVNKEGEYPGWAPVADSKVVGLMSDLYTELFKEEPNVMACHAGLECGILGRNYPDMEMISFGPNIRGAHSPDETVEVNSVQKSWKLLVETLARL